MCAPKIRDGRAAEIEQAISWWRSNGGDVLFLTLTMPHDFGDTLGATWDAVAGGWSDITRSRPWRDLSERLAHPTLGQSGDRLKVHYVRSAEQTHGRNGWHPHLHLSLFVRGALSEAEVAQAEGELYSMWVTQIVSRGWRAPDEQVGCRLEAARSPEQLARYLAKVDATKLHLELARGDIKGASEDHRTPFAILRDIASRFDAIDRAHAEGRSYEASMLEAAQDFDIALWREFEAASHGRRAITWSRGLKAAAGIGDVTDDELAAQERGFVPFVMVADIAWRKLCRARLAGAFVDAAANQDTARCCRLAKRAGVPIGWLSDPPPPP